MLLGPSLGGLVVPHVPSRLCLHRGRGQQVLVCVLALVSLPLVVQGLRVRLLLLPVV